MQSEVSAAYTLTGLGLEPAEVTSRVGVAPSKTWRVGDLIDERALVRYKHSGWRVQSDLPASTSMEEHVRYVLDRLQPGWPALVELGAMYDAEISCVVRVYGRDWPPVHLSSDIVQRIAHLNADIDVDLCVLPSRSKR